MKERTSLIFLEYGELDVIDGSFVLVDVNGVRVQEFPTHPGMNHPDRRWISPGARVPPHTWG
ncbi:MAG TPA: hypothetical protein PLA74_08765, partial [Syntrophales bacterium]|nr:hypothetical protein [Syntrophales bacterium]